MTYNPYKKKARTPEQAQPIGDKPVSSFEGKKNIYVCDKCFGHIVTVDLAEGVTPFMTRCKAKQGCRGMMESSFYRVYDQRMAPDYEWYQPGSTESLDPATADHVQRGGLLLREVEK